MANRDTAKLSSGRGRARQRHAVTLVELLVVISVITLLMAMLLPAVNSARESSRQVTCQNNLRQFGVGFHHHAGRMGTYCSGAFDWLRDGCVTEVGWVADMVNTEIPAGKMLCPSNPNQISETYNDLMQADTATFDNCVDRLGSEPRRQPDGTTIANPCRLIAETPLAAGSEPRRELVEKQIYEKHYNTNYTASWFLVRSSVLIDASGNLKPTTTGCGASLASRNSTVGPLDQARADAASAPSSFIPLLGCGATKGILSHSIGPQSAGVPVVRSFTRGPVLNPSMQPPSFPEGTSRKGAGGWWAVWTHSTLQDYRGFAPVHRGGCNLLFADGSVRGFIDRNDDGLLNNGFQSTSENGFSGSDIELPKQDVFSGWSLRAQ